MRTSALVAVFALAVIWPFGADGKVSVIYGSGNYTCSGWSKIRELRSLPNEVTAQEDWVWGFLSALNLLSSEENADIVGGAYRMDAVIAWLDTYCRQNPLKNVSDAVQELVIELRSNAN